MLKQLEDELQHRTVPRAVALLAEVHAAMKGATRTPPSAVAAAQASASVPDAAPMQSITSNPPQTSAMLPGSAEPREIGAALKEKNAPNMVRSLSLPESAMSLEDAYKVLKSTPGSTWESIEHTRRQLVQQSYPELLKSITTERRARLLADAKRVNAAYETVRQGRRK